MSGTSVSGSSFPVGDEPLRFQYHFSNSRMSFSSTVITRFKITDLYITMFYLYTVIFKERCSVKYGQNIPIYIFFLYANLTHTKLLTVCYSRQCLIEGWRLQVIGEGHMARFS